MPNGGAVRARQIALNPAAMDYPLEDFWNNGFCIVRGVFAPSEVEIWRAAACDMPPNRDLFQREALRDLVLDTRVTALARAILDTDRPAYIGDSNVMVGPTAPGFHKDNVDKDDPNGPDWRGRYPLIRFGLYAQDHRHEPDGLDLRLGSHEHCSVRRGRHVRAATALGDLVIWNMRTSHSGGAMVLRGGFDLDPASYSGRLLRRAPMGLLRRSDTERVGIFWSFAAEGAHLSRYIAYLKTRAYAVDRWRNSPVSGDAVRQAERAGVTLIDIASEIIAKPPARTYRDHEALPY